MYLLRTRHFWIYVLYADLNLYVCVYMCTLFCLLQTSPHEAYHKFDGLAQKHVEVLRKLTKQIQDARIARDNEAIKKR